MLIYMDSLKKVIKIDDYLLNYYGDKTDTSYNRKRFMFHMNNRDMFNNFYRGTLLPSCNYTRTNMKFQLRYINGLRNIKMFSELIKQYQKFRYRRYFPLLLTTSMCYDVINIVIYYL